MMARIKAGAYRFNDVLTVPQVLISAVIPFEVPPFTGECTQELSDRLLAEDGIYIPVGTYTVTYSYSGMAWYLPDEYNPENIPFLDYRDQIAKVVPYNANAESFLSGTASEFYSVNRGWTSDIGEDNQTVIVIEDSDVSEEFYDWFIENATPVTAIITYDSCTIATVPSGRTATLKCQGKVMQSDVVVQVPMQSASEGGDTQAAYDQGYAEGYTEGYEKAESTNPFYYATTLHSVFASAVFPENYEAVIKVKKAPANSSYIYHQAKGYKSSKLISEDNTNVIAFNHSHRVTLSTFTLELVDLTEYNRKFSSLQEAFRGQIKLKSVLGALDLSECTNVINVFMECYALEDVEFVPNTINISIVFNSCTKLTKASITSIINGLSADTSELTVTLSKTAVNNAFTDEEWATLIATKPNWTISLS